MQHQKQQNDLDSFPRQTIQYYSNPSLCPNNWCLRSWGWTVKWDLQELLELTPKIDILFIIENWNAKVGSQQIPGLRSKFGLGVQNEAGQRLTEFCQENALLIADTLSQQRKRQLYTWTSPYRQYQNQIDYILCSHRWRSSIQSKNKDPELTAAQIISSSSSFCWLYRASPSLAAKNIINLVSLLTIWLCLRVELSRVFGRGCLLWPVHSLGKTLLAFALLHFVFPRPNLPVTSGISWLPTFAFQSPMMKRTSFFGVSSRRCYCK